MDSIRETEFYSFYKNRFGQNWELILGFLHEDQNKKIYTSPYYNSEKNHSEKLELDPFSFQVTESFDLLQKKSLGDLNYLDLCAAPGGKSIYFHFLYPEIKLKLNDLSKNRMKRLRSMTNEFIPKEVQNSKIEFSCQPGESFYQYKNEYDFVLADVPCSGERHVVENKKRLNEWKFKQSKYLQKRQFGILCAAVDAVKSEGQVTYSTCSMLDEENDHQIQKLIKRCKKKDIQIEVILENKKLGKCTEFGVQILPHLSAGAGPGYYASFKVMKS